MVAHGSTATSCANAPPGWLSTLAKAPRPLAGAYKRVADQLGVHPDADVGQTRRDRRGPASGDHE